MMQHAWLICARWRHLPWKFSVLLLALVLAAGCGGGDGAAQATESIGYADLPAGVGRGFPSAIVDTEPTPGGILQKGEPAPDFTMALADGRFLRLSDLRGRPVVLNFWATWCGPCRAEMPELVKAAAADDELVVLAVDVQEALAPVEEFAAEFEMDFPVVMDTEGAVRQLFRVPGLPTTYFVDREGSIASVVVGPLTPQVLEDRLAEVR
jgi:thiol-disulfide isomerase/thioredoxin